jgi:hypothetical protein
MTGAAKGTVLRLLAELGEVDFNSHSSQTSLSRHTVYEH